MSGPECCANPPILNPTCGEGSVIELGGLKTYVSGPSDSKSAIILAGDAYGCDAPNLRKFADKLAAAGYYVVVPDFFHGEPYDPNNPELPLPLWLQKYNTDNGVKDAIKVIEALRSDGVSAIGAAGFCWGAKVAVDLGKAGYIQAAVLLHPAFVTVDDIKAVKVPVSILGAEVDQSCPAELVEQFEEIFASRPEVKGYTKLFSGVSHGWTIRYKDEEEEKRAKEAHKDTLDWFLEHMK